MDLAIYVTPSSFSIPFSLNDEERAHSLSFRYELDRRRYVFAHNFKRHVLSLEYPDIFPSDWVITKSPECKPFLTAPISFNLSHSKEAVAMVAAVGQSELQIGIDVECYQKIEDLDELIQLICHPNELARVELKVDRHKSFYCLWTAKESLLKAVGSGLVDNLKELDCSECLVKESCSILWNNQEFGLQTYKFDWGVCSVAWNNAIKVDSLHLANQSKLELLSNTEINEGKSCFKSE